jgi:hypothetical protein
METNALSVKELTWQHSRKWEGRNGAEELELGQNIYYMHCWYKICNKAFLNETRDVIVEKLFI